jgi:hypothetical protein
MTNFFNKRNPAHLFNLIWLPIAILYLFTSMVNMALTTQPDTQNNPAFVLVFLAVAIAVFYFAFNWFLCGSNDRARDAEQKEHMANKKKSELESQMYQAECKAKDVANEKKYVDEWRAFLEGRIDLPPLPINGRSTMWEEMARPLVAISHRRKVLTDETIAREFYPDMPENVINSLATTARCELATGKLHVKYAEGIPA